MDLKNKTVVFLGSSVTYGVDNWSMCEYLRESTDLNVVKRAVSATTLVDTYERSYIARMLEAIDDQPECDMFICQLSTNDAAKGVTLGVISDKYNKEEFDRSTVIGAIEYIVALAKEKWECPVAFYTGTYFESENYQNMVDALLKLSEKWNFGIIDLWNDPEMRAVSPEDYKRYMNDKVHPSKLGYIEWWGPKFKKFIERA